MILFVTIIAPLSGCTMVHFSYLMDLSLAPLFLYLFYRFYKTTFEPRKKTEEANGCVKPDKLQNGSAKKEIVTNGSMKNHAATNGSMKNHANTNGTSKKEE